jgi:hypothetical protein
VTIAVGAIKLIPKLKGIIEKIKAAVDKAKEKMAEAGRAVLCKLAGGCFVAGTVVAMADGSFVPIENLAEDCVVQSALPGVLPGQQTISCIAPASETSARIYEGALITLEVVDRSGKSATVAGTPEHPFWSASRHAWVPIGQLAIGEILDGTDGGVRVFSRQVAFKRLVVFNLGVSETHTYRVTPLGVLVHNDPPCKRVNSATLRKKWEKEYNQEWPKTATGENYHVSHKKALADGGTNDLSNIEPMDPGAHIQMHVDNGDFARWGSRSGR